MGDQRGAARPLCVLALGMSVLAPLLVPPARGGEIQTEPTAAAATTQQETPSVRVRLLGVGGGGEQYEFMSTGRVRHETDWSSSELGVPPERVASGRRKLLRCGICDLEDSVPPGTDSGKQRLIVELAGRRSPCTADLPTGAWSATARSRRCLAAVRWMIEPLVGHCDACGVP